MAKLQKTYSEDVMQAVNELGQMFRQRHTDGDIACIVQGIIDKTLAEERSRYRLEIKEIVRDARDDIRSAAEHAWLDAAEELRHGFYGY